MSDLPPPPAAEVRPSEAPASLEEEAEVDRGRVRVGFDFDVGAGAGAGTSGLFFGAKLRIGWQLDRRVAACLQGSMFWWDSSTMRVGDGTSTGGAIGFQLTPLFSLTPTDRFEVAAGPSLDRLYPLSVSSTLSSTTASINDSIYSSAHLGIHGRLAVLFGKGPAPPSGRRTAFALGADVHATLVDGGALAFVTLGVGTEWY